MDEESEESEVENDSDIDYEIKTNLMYFTPAKRM